MRNGHVVEPGSAVGGLCRHATTKAVTIQMCIDLVRFQAGRMNNSVRLQQRNGPAGAFFLAGAVQPTPGRQALARKPLSGDTRNPRLFWKSPDDSSSGRRGAQALSEWPARGALRAANRRSTGWPNHFAGRVWFNTTDTGSSLPIEGDFRLAKAASSCSTSSPFAEVQPGVEPGLPPYQSSVPP